MLLRNTRAVWLTISCMSLSQPASAQMFANLAPNLAMNRLMLAPVMAQANRVASGWEQEAELSSSVRTPSDENVLVFDVSQKRRASNLKSFAQKSLEADPEGSADLAKRLVSGDVIDTLGQAIAPLGLRVNNVADAYALWWLNAWAAAHGVDMAEDRGIVNAVQTQASRAIMAVPAYTQASEAEKQNFAEAMLVQAMLVSALNDKYRNDSQYGPQLRQAAAKGAEGMGLDLTAMELTREGFVMRDGASAADRPVVSGGEAPAALAAAGVDARTQGGEPVAGGTDLSDYALPALGGTAALAAVFLLGRAAGRRG